MTLISPPPNVDDDPVIKALDEFWQGIAKESVSKSVETLNDLARQLLTVAGILEGLYFHAITFSDLRGHITGWLLVVYLLPIVLLLITVAASIIVLFPEKSGIEITDWVDAKKSYEHTVKSKELVVRIASYSLLAAIVSLLVAVGFYLIG